MITWILIGAGLGFILEGAGFGNPRKLTGVFLLRDWAVPQVMVTAILASMAGVLVLPLFGVDTATFFTPGTWYAAQALGGFVFGVGFYVGGYCPGTSLVGAASGRLDALGFMAGLVGGYYVWDAIKDSVRGVFERVPRGEDTLPALVGLDPRVFAGIMVAAGGAVVVWLFRRSLKAGRRTA